jgi:hypothetical protein
MKWLSQQALQLQQTIPGPFALQNVVVPKPIARPGSQAHNPPTDAMQPGRPPLGILGMVSDTYLDEPKKRDDSRNMWARSRPKKVASFKGPRYVFLPLWAVWSAVPVTSVLAVMVDPSLPASWPGEMQCHRHCHPKKKTKTPQANLPLVLFLFLFLLFFAALFYLIAPHDDARYSPFAHSGRCHWSNLRCIYSKRTSATLPGPPPLLPSSPPLRTLPF